MQKLVDKSQFETFQRNSRIEALLPELIKRLIRNGAGPNGYERLRIPDGEGYRDKGLDGQVLLHEPVAMVPSGEVRIEIGATSDLKSFKAKAEKEYRRVQSIVGDEAAKMSFVIIGRVSWDGQVEIEAEDGSKEAVEWRLHIGEQMLLEGLTPFADCIVIDQSNLIDWINEDTESAIWWLTALQHRSMRGPRNVCTFEERVDRYKLRFKIDVDPAILTVEQDLTGLVTTLQPNNPTVIVGNSAQEAAVAACQHLLLGGVVEDRPCVVVDREAGVELLEGVATPHVVVLEGEAAQLANRLPHHILIIARPLLHSAAQPSDVVLHRPTNEGFARHLGVHGTRADSETIARAVGRTMTALERGYGTDAALAQSPWQAPDVANHDLICKLAILGGWNSGTIYDRKTDETRLAHRDLELIHKLCGLGPVGKDGSIEKIVKQYGREEGRPFGAADPLFSTGPSVVNLTAPVDAFYRLAPQYTAGHYRVLSEALRTVLHHKAENPINRGELFDASEHYGYSSTFVGGLILSFVLLGVFGHDDFMKLSPEGRSSPRWCEELYYDAIPSLGAHPQFADSISQYLPLLAEGLSHPFLRSLEMLLEGNADTIRSIFQPREAALGMHTYHLGNALLWALERISWKREHLIRSARIMMGLHIAAGEIPSNIGNQPLTSLRGLLSPGIPQTEANLGLRLQAYDTLAKDFGVRALDLFADLLDSRGGFQMSQSHPIFDRVVPPKITYGEFYEARDHIAELAIGLVESAPTRAVELIDAIASMIDPLFERFVAVIKKVPPNSEAAVRLSEELREYIGRHSEFPDADWSLPETRLMPLREAQEGLLTDPLLKSRWLFENSWVNLHDGDRAGSYNRIDKVRRSAIPPLIKEGTNTVLAFAASVNAPFTVGAALGQEVSDVELVDELIVKSVEQLDVDKLQPFLRGLSHGLALDDPTGWLKRLTDAPSEWSTPILRSLGEGLTSTETVIELIATSANLPDQITSGFWTWMNIHALHHFKPSSATIGALFEHGRAHDLAAIVDSQKSKLTDEVVENIFDVFLDHFAVAANEGRQSDMTLYHFWKLVEVVEDRGLRTLKQIAYSQFPLSRTLRFNGPERPAALHRLLASEPFEFIEIVKLGYRKDTTDDEHVEADSDVTLVEEKVAPHMAENAYHALDSLTLLPGWQEGELESARMQAWIKKALSLAKDNHRIVATEIAIGNLLGKSPADPEDELWPHRAVRDVIESGVSSRLVRCIQTGEANNRGVYSGSSRIHHKNMADKFRAFAEAMETWPRTKEMLHAIVRSEMHWVEREIERERDMAAAHGMR